MPQRAEELLSAFDLADHHYQTDRYYSYACGIVAQQDRDSEINGYVLFPNYMLHSISKEIDDTLFSENYKMITYRELYEFFRSIKNNVSLWNDCESKYIDEFLLAMKKHTKDVDNSFEEEMKARFYKQIQMNY